MSAASHQVIMGLLCCASRQHSEDHDSGHKADVCMRGWLVKSPPEPQSQAKAWAHRPTWKRQYFVLTLVRALDTSIPNHYQLRFYSKSSPSSYKGSISLERVTNLCMMTLPPAHLLDSLDCRYYAQYQNQGRQEQQVLPLHQQRDVCEQLPLFSFESEWRRDRCRFYLLAEDGRAMREWVASLRDACGLADRGQEEDVAAVALRPLVPQQQPLPSQMPQPLTPRPQQPSHQQRPDEDAFDGIYRGPLSPGEAADGNEDGIYRGPLSPDEAADGNADGIYAAGVNTGQRRSDEVPEIAADVYGNPDQPGDEYHVPAADEDEYRVPAADEDEYRIPAADEDEYRVPAADEDEYRVPVVDEDEYRAPTADEDEARAPAAFEDEDSPAAHDAGYRPPGASQDDSSKAPAARGREKESDSSRSSSGLDPQTVQQQQWEQPPPGVTPRQFKPPAAFTAADDVEEEPAEATNTDYENLSAIARAIRAPQPEMREAPDDVYGNLS